MATCARTECGRWRPDALIRLGRSGVRLDGAWYCSPTCVAMQTRRVLHAVHTAPAWIEPKPASPLGRVLVQQRALAPEDVELGLKAQRSSGLALGRQLVALGLLTREELLRGLAAQAGVGYLSSIDAARVRRGPGGLSRDTVRALGVVPFEPCTEDRLSVACVAPLPRLALAALREMTGAVVDAFLVDDDLHAGLLDVYGLERRGPWADATTLTSVDDAAERIARLAARDGTATMTHARCEPFVWVRVDGRRQHTELLLPVQPGGQETPWPVGLTSL